MEDIQQSPRWYSMEFVYSVLGGSRQKLDQELKRKEALSQLEDHIVEQTQKWRERHSKMGSRAMYYSMLNKGIDLGVGVNKFEQIVSRRGLTVGKLKKWGPKTTDGKGVKEYPNLTNGLKINNINKLVVGDITYYYLENRWHYIFTLKDVYSQRILSLHPSVTMDGEQGVKSLLEMEKERGTIAYNKTIHHSDNGSQYRYWRYLENLKRLGMRISRAINCIENGSAEQLNHVAKNMYLKNWSISNMKELTQACAEVKFLNNYERGIAQLNYRTPEMFEKYIKGLSYNERPVKEMYDFLEAE